MSLYPEHDKLKPKAEFDILKLFCESLDERGIQLSKWDKKDNTEIEINPKDLLYEWFGTTDKKLERERVLMLRQLTQDKKAL